MKKRIPSLSKFLSPVTLYLDDINEIVDKMHSVTPEVSFATKDYGFDSLEEVREMKGDKLKELYITGGRYDISVDIKKHSVYLHTWGGSEANAALWHSLREYLKRKSGWHSRFLNIGAWSIIFAFWLIGSLILLTITERRAEVYHSAKSLTFVTGGITLFFLILCFLNLWKGSKIYLDRRHKVGNFWERNRDEIIKGIIYALIGGVITVVGKLLYTYLK